LLLVLGAAVVGLAFPAGAMARLYTLRTSSVAKNSGFKIHLYSVNTTQGYGAPNQSTLWAVLTRTRGHATQTIDYAFSRGVKLSGSKHLGSGRVAGTLRGGHGSINMTFHATGSATRAAGACGGLPGHKRTGTLNGSLVLNANKLGTVKVKSFRATLSNASNNCTFPTPSCSSKGYLLEGTHPGAYICAAKRSAKALARELIQVSKRGPGWGASYTYSVANEPTSTYQLNTSNLSSATVMGVGGIGGKATYKGGPSSHYSYGMLTGSLWVRMAALGPVRPFASAKNHSITGDQRHP
jgi:hypothetical protein